MATVQELFEVTKELGEFLEQPFPKEEREGYIERVEQLLEMRANILTNFKDTKKNIDSDTAKAIVSWNKKIEQRLSLYMSTIKVDINKLKQQKQTGMKYENPYDTQTDGFFIDKKN